MEKLKSVYNENPDNPEVFRDVLKTLLINDCDKNDVFVKELIVKDSLYIIKIQHMGCVIYLPDVQGTDLLCKGLEDEAIPYFERALTMGISQQRKASSNYYLARIYHSRGGAANFKIARDYYEAAAKLKPDWGDPYIEIGKMYASSVRSCGNNDGFTMGMIVNTAIDMWNKAKLIDESVATKADNLISKYSTSIPTKEDGFQRGIKEGDAYTVRCWIQRMSTVRLRSQY